MHDLMVISTVKKSSPFQLMIPKPVYSCDEAGYQPYSFWTTWVKDPFPLGPLKASCRKRPNW